MVFYIFLHRISWAFQKCPQLLSFTIRKMRNLRKPSWACFVGHPVSKQEIDLFIPLPVLWPKNFLYNMLHIFTKEFEIVFQNRKWNYLNRKWNYFPRIQAFDQKTTFTKISHFHQRVPNWFSKQETELSKQEIELSIPFPALWSKTSFTRCSTFFQRSFKLIFKDGIIKTGNGII